MLGLCRRRRRLLLLGLLEARLLRLEACRLRLLLKLLLGLSGEAGELRLKLLRRLLLLEARLLLLEARRLGLEAGGLRLLLAWESGELRLQRSTSKAGGLRLEAAAEAAHGLLLAILLLRLARTASAVGSP